MREGWITKTLGEIGKIASGKSIPSSDIVDTFSNGLFPCYGGNGLRGYVNKYTYDGKYPIIGRVGALCGNVHLAEGKFYPTEHALVMSLKNGDNAYFIKYLLLSLGLNSFAKGVAQPVLSAGTLSRISVPIPPLQEQERIVAELDLLTGIIDKQKQQLKELDTLAQSIFYDMFGSPDANEKEWIMKSLAEIGTIVSGSTPSTSDESNWDGDVNWVTPAELGVQLFYGETQRKITSKAAKSLTIMPIGTLLMSSRAPIGKLAITSVPMCCNQGFKNIVCGNNVNNIYLYYYLMLNINSIKAMGRGATFKEVSKQAVSSFKIMLPPMNLQESFAKKIQSIESQKQSINRSIAESQKLFDYTMDKYFG